MIFLKGYAIGLGMIIFIGPVFFTLITQSVRYGRIAGYKTALGIFTGDLLASFLTYHGFAQLNGESLESGYLSIIGTAVLLFFGIRMIVKSGEQHLVSSKRNPGYINGFLVNFINPFVFFVWIGISAYVHKNFATGTEKVLYISGILAGILSTDLTKVYFSGYLKRWLTPQHLKWLYRICGALLILFSLRLLYHALSVFVGV
ncbi:MAG: hypothetical protein GC181_05360 [Bacteroidetes bacterium]|nr:hypothetical protein [Bacteroidota bacterium]